MTTDRSPRPLIALYAEVTDRIISELEAGRLPWVRPWDAGNDAGMPCNAGTGRRYSGINVLILWNAVVEHGFASQRWITFKQAQALGGYVRKGERGTTVFYADRFTPKREDKPGLPLEDGEEHRQVAFLKRFTVFNFEQCEGMSEAMAPEPARSIAEDDLIPAADALIAATGADFRIGGDEAFYAPAQDYIRVPPKQAFRDLINWYRTALHELGHWTAHTSRLSRLEREDLEGLPYAREELVAEMCSAFVCAELGIAPTVRHSDYIATWLDVLRCDSRAIFRAASQASKAADYLLAFRRCGGDDEGHGVRP